METKDKRRIYDLLCNKFEFNQKYPMAKISKYLSDNSIKCTDYNYSKMLIMFKDMGEFIEVEDIMIVNNKHQNIILHEWNEGTETPTVTADSSSELNESLTSIYEKDDDSLKLPESLDEIIINPNVQEMLNQFLTGVFDKNLSIENREKLRKSYENAYRNNKFRKMDSGAYKGTIDIDDTPVILTIEPNKNPSRRKWWLKYIDVEPGWALTEFAYIDKWNDPEKTPLNQLAKICSKENWGLHQDTLYVLRNYLQYTFYRLKKEGKIKIDKEKGFACFNTGLVTERYDDIYACFTKNIDGAESPWAFTKFAFFGDKSGEITNMKKCFGDDYPKPANYLEEPERLIFNPDIEFLDINDNHIIVQNISRFPLEYLNEKCTCYEEAKPILTNLNEAFESNDKENIELQFNKLRKYLNDTSKNLYTSIHNDLMGAIDRAKKRVRFNYKTAVPIYFPKSNTISLLLPISLPIGEEVDTNKTDFAIVVNENHASNNRKNYCIQTILTLDQAYVDARLICRPESNWLKNT